MSDLNSKLNSALKQKEGELQELQEKFSQTLIAKDLELVTALEAITARDEEVVAVQEEALKDKEDELATSGKLLPNN